MIANCDDGSYKIRKIIIGRDDQEIPTSDGDIAKLKDGICGNNTVSNTFTNNTGSNESAAKLYIF